MKKLFQHEATGYVIFFLAVLLSRLPFLNVGYGLDSDSWGVALVAKNIAHTGTYEVSRFPGYPVHEFMCSLFGDSEPFILNFLTALISTVGFLFFAFTLRELRFKYIFLASTALACVPVIYIHSTTTIDYTWALTFILICFYFVVVNYPILAGTALGIAIGCRITSGAMLIPMCVMLITNNGFKRNAVRITKIVVTTSLVGALIYLPVFLRYGISFFSYFDAPYPRIPKVLFKFFIEPWGTLGLLGLVIGTGLLFLPNRITARKYLFPRSVNEKYVVAWLIAIDLYIIAFLKLPMESGYLIPIIPFLILLFGKYLYNKAFTFFAIMLIAAPFFCDISPMNRDDSPTNSALAVDFNVGSEKLAFDPLCGPVLAYQSRRKNAEKFTEHVLATADTVKHNSVIISGRWFNQVMLSRKDTLNPNVQYRAFMNQDTLFYYLVRNYSVYYLPQQEIANKLKYGTDMSAYGAIPFIKKEE